MSIQPTQKNVTRNLSSFKQQNIFIVISTIIWCTILMRILVSDCRCTLPRIRLSIALIFILSVAINITDWCTIEAYNDGYRIRMRNRPLYDSVQAYYYVYFVSYFCAFIWSYPLSTKLYTNTVIFWLQNGDL